jgi:outer membrane biosynthesis protein TonB
MPQMPDDERPDSHLLNGPALQGGLDQSVVDALFGDVKADVAVPSLEFTEPAPPPPAPKPAPAPTPAAKPAPKPAPKPAATPEPSATLDQSSIDSLFS